MRTAIENTHITGTKTDRIYFPPPPQKINFSNEGEMLKKKMISHSEGHGPEL